MRRAARVELGPEERARLTRWRSGSGPRRLRASIVLLAAEGQQDLQIARALSVDRQTAARWRRRFLQERTAGLDESRPTLRSGRIAEERLQAVVRATLAGPPRGAQRWSTRRLAAEFGVSHMTVRRLWESYSLRPAGFAAPAGRADPAHPLEPWDVVGLALRGPTAVLALTLHRSLPALATRSVAGRNHRANPARDERAAILRSGAAFRSLPEDSERRAGPITAHRFARFVDAVSARAGPSLAVRILASGVTDADRRWFERWHVRHPRVELESVESLAAWRERARWSLDSLGRGPRPRGQYRGRAEVSVALRRTVAEYSGDSAGFEWTAPARSVAAGEAAYRLRHALAVTARGGFKTPEATSTDMAPPEPPSEADRLSARAILRHNLGVRRGERVTIEAWTATLSYGNAFVLEALRLGARPLLLYQDELTYWAATTEIPARSLGNVGEHRRAALERTDVFVSFLGPSDRERFHSLPSPMLFRLGEYQDAMYAAAAKAGARAVQMAVGRVSPASARMYHVTPDAWRDELVSATLVAPSVLQRRAARVARSLTKGREILIRHANGTELSLRLRGLPPVRSDGRVPRALPRADWSLVTLPAGVVTVPLDERFASGGYRSNVRCSTGLSDSVGDFADGAWTFEDGRLRRFRYAVGEELFEQSYGRAGDGRDRPAALSIGLNERIVSAPLLEDQSLGMVTLQIGRNSHLGGRTRSGWWAWSFLRGATVAIDGSLILRDGRLVP